MDERKDEMMGVSVDRRKVAKMDDQKDDEVAEKLAVSLVVGLVDYMVVLMVYVTAYWRDDPQETWKDVRMA